MEKKVSKIRENVRSFQSQGKSYYVHVINFEEDPGVDFEYNSITTNCVKFQVGVSTEVEIIDDKFGKKVKPVQIQKTGGGYSGKKETKDQGAITWLSCFSSVCNLYSGSSFVSNFDELLQKANKAFEEAVKHSSK